MSRSKRPLVPDAELWRRVAEQVKPLKSREAARPRPKPGGAPDPLPAGGPVEERPLPAPPAVRPQATTAPIPVPPIPASGLDRRTAERFRRGQLPLAATLDLHGMTQAAAHAALEAFVYESWNRGRRFVVIVTGKGGRGEDDWGRPQRGILRRMVPRWLKEPGLAGFVLSTAPARPQHGGEGALYLLLRRKREG